MTAEGETKYRFMDGIHTGALQLRLAENAEEVAAAQALRYRVFYEEMGAQPSAEMAAAKRDFDRYDAFCDHLVVIDHDRPEGPSQVVGTYRLHAAR